MTTFEYAVKIIIVTDSVVDDMDARQFPMTVPVTSSTQILNFRRTQRKPFDTRI